MNTKFTKKSYFYLFFVCVVFLFFFMISRWAPVAGDDWVYAVGGRYTSNPFMKAYEFYQGWSGRYFSELWGFLVADHKALWNILNAGIFTGVFYMLLKDNKIQHVILSCVIGFMLMVTVSEGLRVQTYTWIMGTTYVIPLLLFFIQIYLLYGYVFKNKKDIIRIILLCVLNFMIPLYMENAAALMVGANLLVLIYLLLNNKPKVKMMCLITFVSIVGLLLIYFSPGAQLRMFRDHGLFHSLPLFTKIDMNWKNFILYTFRDHRWLTRIISLCAICITYQNRKENPIWLSFVLYFVFGLSILQSLSWTLFDLTKINLFYILADLNVPHSVMLNTVISLLWILGLIIICMLCCENNKGIYGIYLILCALGANAVMLISPIFDTRSSIYTVYLFILFAIYLLNECKLDHTIQYVGILLGSILCIISVYEYMRLYHLIHLVDVKRNAQIQYYINHPEEKEMWFIAYPRERVHSGNIEEGDETHFYYFKEYHGLNQENNVHFYYLDDYTEQEIEKS